MKRIDHRYPKGFRPLLKPEVATQIRAFMKTDLLARVAETLLNHGSIVAIGAVAVSTAIIAPWWMAVAVYAPAIAVIARQQRVLELFVHDASHNAWHHKNRRWNDLFANLLAAFPTLSEVGAYRKFHTSHHAYYGTDGLDPCKRRLATFSKMTLLGYIIDWYREIGSKGPRLLLSFATWHLLVYILPLALVFGAVGPLLWVAFWLVPMLTALPALRRVAEAEEHDYERADTEFATTYSNLGFYHRLLIHPAGDAYHLLHHMWPGMPMNRHHKAHSYLVQHVPEYSDGLVRTTVLKKD